MYLLMYIETSTLLCTYKSTNEHNYVHFIFIHTAPATKTDPLDTEAALSTFDEYYNFIHDYVEIEMFTSKCVGYGVIHETSPITGASVFLPDNLKMNIVLPLIRRNIGLNGKSVFLLMVKVLNSMGNYRPLAKALESMYVHTCMYARLLAV